MAKPKMVNVHEAKTHFSKLLKRVERGDDVIIARAGHAIARLTALAPPRPPDRVAGTGKGFFTDAELDQILAPLPPQIQRYFDGADDDQR